VIARPRDAPTGPEGSDPAEVVNPLKAQPGGDVIAYGGCTLVSGLIA
jgi:hypothetical protein